MKGKNRYLLDPVTSRRRGLLATLAEWPSEAVGPSERERLVEQLTGFYRHDPDAGVHSLAEVVLMRWGFRDRSSSPAIRRTRTT